MEVGWEGGYTGNFRPSAFGWFEQITASELGGLLDDVLPSRREEGPVDCAVGDALA